MKGAGLYIRLSKEDEREGESQSVRNQRAMLLDFAEKNALPVREIYTDDGYSGTSFDRPAFRRMLADIEKGQIDTVLTKDLSRLGRDYILTGYYLERWFPEHGVRYISLLDGIDTRTESGANDVTPFRAVLNDMYAKDISRKIRSVKRDKQMRGLFIGPKPVYGYKKPPGEKNRLVIDETAAKVVRRVFAMACAGESCRAAADALNAQGIDPPAVYAHARAQGKWSAESIARMLQNRIYAGDMVQGRRARAGYKSPKNLTRPPEDWIIVENTHEAIVSRAVFEQANRMLSRRKSTRVRRHDHPLKGLVFCRECGKPLTLLARGETLYFVCPSYKKRLGCKSHLVSAQALSDLLTGFLRDLCADRLRGDALTPAALDALRTLREKRQAREKASEEKLARIEDALDRLRLAGIEGTAQGEDDRRLERKLKAQRDAIVTRAPDNNLSPAQEHERARTLAQAFLDRLERNRAFTAAFVRRAELSEDGGLLVYLACSLPPSDVSRIEKKAVQKLGDAMRAPKDKKNKG